MSTLFTGIISRFVESCVSDLPEVSREWIPLNTAEAGNEVTFRCITETGERDAVLLSFLYDHEVGPGTRIDILDVAPSLGTISLKVGDHEVVLGLEAAGKIYVQ